MLVRTLVKPLHGVDNGSIYDCSTGGDAVSGTAFNGVIHDRLDLGRHFQVAVPIVHGAGLATTAANKKVQVDVKLQHGDEAGGGDMADYSTGFQPATVVHNTSAESTEFTRWSTGAGDYRSGYCAYDLRAAKRYFRMVGTITMPGASTSTGAGAAIDYAGCVALMGADEDPPLNVLSPTAESTSTSTG